MTATGGEPPPAAPEAEAGFFRNPRRSCELSQDESTGATCSPERVPSKGVTARTAQFRRRSEFTLVEPPSQNQNFLRTDPDREPSRRRLLWVGGHPPWTSRGALRGTQGQGQGPASLLRSGGAGCQHRALPPGPDWPQPSRGARVWGQRVYKLTNIVEENGPQSLLQGHKDTEGH